MPKEEKQIYKILAQKDGVTLTANTHEVTYDEAQKIANKFISEIHKDITFEPFVVLPVTTKERWDSGFINFCPRCGASLQDEELEQYADVYCHECDASMGIQVFDICDADDC